MRARSLGGCSACSFSGLRTLGLAVTMSLQHAFRCSAGRIALLRGSQSVRGDVQALFTGNVSGATKVWVMTACRGRTRSRASRYHL
jgi:hypothetical protein